VAPGAETGLYRGIDKFAKSADVTKRAISREPDSYGAHASLATALFKLRQYPEAAREFIWIVRVRPEVAASYLPIRDNNSVAGEALPNWLDRRNFGSESPNSNALHGLAFETVAIRDGLEIGTDRPHDGEGTRCDVG
jgi:hypothetical protein